jgi:hypothetical protein
VTAESDQDPDPHGFGSLALRKKAESGSGSASALKPMQIHNTGYFSDPSSGICFETSLFRWAGSLLPGGEEVSWSGLARGVGLANILEGLDAHFQVNLFKKSSTNDYMYRKIKGLVAVCHSFCIYFSLYNRYSRDIHTIIHPSFINIRSVGGTSLGCRLPSRDSNSGLPYSKPARHQLSHSAPY